MKQGGATEHKPEQQTHDKSIETSLRVEKPEPVPEQNSLQTQFGNATIARYLEQQPPTTQHSVFGGDQHPNIAQLQQGLGNAAVAHLAAANALPMQQQTTVRKPDEAANENKPLDEMTTETSVAEDKSEKENNDQAELKADSSSEKKKIATNDSKKAQAKKEAEKEKDEQAKKVAESVQASGAKNADKQQAAAGAGAAKDSGGGGAPPLPSVGGGDPQGGSEDDGIAELEARLANADPERASADEADPVDIATGEPDTDEENSTLAEPTMPMIPEPVDSSPIPTPNDTLSDSHLSESATMPGMDVAEPTVSEAEGDFAPAAIDEPDSVGGFSGDEPALGGGAAAAFGSADLSEPEKQAALGSIGESSGVGGDVGGGGGGSAIADTPPAEVPDVASESPESALAKVSRLPPVQMAQALGGVKGAVVKDSGEARSELAANPPQMERPTGSPKNLHQQAAKSDTGKQSEVGNKVAKTPEGADQPTPQPEPLSALPPPPTDQIVQPAVQAGDSGELSERDTARLSGTLNSLPTRDPGLHATTGPAPRVMLSGNADPAQSDAQRQELQTGIKDSQAQGKQDVAREMGENTQIYPSVEPETLTAKIPESAGAGAAKGESTAIGSADPESLSILAQKEKGGEIQAALAKAQGDMATQKAEYADKVASEKTDSANDIQALEDQSATDQAQARSEAQAEVKAKKGEWGKEQENLVQKAEKEADGEITLGRTDIQKEKQTADDKAAKEVESGNREAEHEREKAEKKAREEKSKGEKESSGFFGWLASKATAFFNKIKSAVTAVFDLARKAIKKAIEFYKKAAMWVIEQARKAIVAVIKAVGKVLIAIGDRLLAAFPKLRDKFRKFIQSKVDKAVSMVNALAEKLKKGVSVLLDLLAAGLDKLIGWLEKGMLAVVDAYAAVVKGAIKFAEGVAQALGAFFVLIKDIAANPIQWLANLAAGVVGGIKNHLWKAFKEAVKEWFNSKLEQVLGLGQMVWGLIKSGGLSLAMVGKMAWEGIKAMIPPTLIRILVEKLAAMIVPAVGAIMVIIEGLQAAWGTVQRIIAAFQKFFAFLKAVKGGNAGLPFAQALAAAAIAVIDFVANWLILKLAKGAAKIGGKIKGLAKKILGRKKGRAKVKKAKKPKKAKHAKAKKKKTGAAKKGKRSAKDRKAERKKAKDKKNRERLERAVKAIEPKIKHLLKNGVGKRYLKARLLLWRARYRLSSLAIVGGVITASINPKKKITQISNAKLGALLRPLFAKAETEYEDRLMDDHTTKAKIEDAKARYEAGDKSALKDLSRFEQAKVIRETKVPPVTGRHREPESGVKVWIPKPGGRGMVQHAGRYESGVSRKGRKIASITDTLSKYATQFNVSDNQMGSIFTGHPQDIEGKLGLLKSQLLSKQTSKTGRIQVGRFINRLRRVAFLTQAFEPSRVGGIATTTAVASTMVSSGDVTLKETISAKGSMAPMMQKHVAPESGEAQTPEQKKAASIRDKRIGQVFNSLLEVAERQDVLVARGGYDLKGLADAIREYLKVVQKRYRTKDEFNNAKAQLIAEVVKLLSSYHGR